jgi:hypothetical protein
MSDNWFYNYLKQFADNPTPANPSNVESSQTGVAPPKKRKEEEDITNSLTPDTLREGEGVGTTNDRQTGAPKSAPSDVREVDRFAKAPPVILADIKGGESRRQQSSLERTAVARVAAIHRRGRGKQPTSAPKFRKQNIDDVDGGRENQQPSKKVKSKSTLIEKYPGLARFK